MQIIDIVTIILGVGLLLLGYIRGFGRALKGFTDGIVGIIISIFVCVAFGGMILGTKGMTKMVSGVNQSLGAKWEFLAKIQIGVIIFYIVMFVVVQVLRILIVKLVCGVFEADNKVMNIVNRALGMIFVPGIAFVFLLLFLAFLKLFDGTAAMDGLLRKLDGSIMAKLYEINPIVFHV